jgi:choline kinase
MLNVVILAAGSAQRLNNHFGEVPKCLIKIKGTEILLIQYEILKRLRHTRIYLVAGPQLGLVNTFIKDRDLEIEVIVNESYSSRGSMHSLECAFNKIGEDLIVIEGDLIFDPSVLSRVISSNENAIIVTNHSGSGDEMTPFFSQGYLQNFVKEKNASSQFPEYMGISFFKKPLLSEMIKLNQESSSKLSYEECLGRTLEKYKMSLNFVYFPQLLWSDLDTPADVRRFEDIYLKLKEFF